MKAITPRIVHRLFLKLFAIAIFCFSLHLSAQPLNGVYTIGNTAADYSTISAAVADLSANGVNGPVIFNINAGNYNEQVSIPAVIGASATNTITFQSTTLDSNSTVISYYANTSSSNFVFQLNGSNYIIIKNLTIHAQGISYQKAITLLAAASNNVFSNNVIKGTNTTANNDKTLIHFNGWSGDGFQHNKILNNRFENGGHQVYIECIHAATTSFDNPIIGNHFTGNSGPSIRTKYQNGIEIRNNKVTGVKSGIGVFYLEDSGTNSIIEKNIVTPSSNPSLLIKVNNAVNMLIVNNFFSGGTISIDNTIGTKFYNNSCHYFGEYHGFQLDGLISNTASIFNNIFSSNSGGFIGSSVSIDTSVVRINHNIYYTPNSQTKFTSNGGSPMEFTVWQNTFGVDLNSFLSNPFYISSSDLHINNAWIPNGNAVPLPEVPDDIDGEIRSTTEPDIGADEYSLNLATFRDIEMVGHALNSTPCTMETSLTILVANHSTFPINSFTVTHFLFGILKDSTVINSVILPGDTAIVNLGAYTFTEGTQYNFLVKLALPNGLFDNHSNNDIGEIRYSHLSAVEIKEKELNCSTGQELFIQPQPLSTILWSTGETTSAIVPPSPGTYSVTVTDQYGCSQSDSYTIN